MLNTEFTQIRSNMVSNLRACCVTDADVLQAMGYVAREEFIREGYRDLAYADWNIPITASGRSGRVLMSPWNFSRLIQCSHISTGDNILVVGAGCGYGLAVISKITDGLLVRGLEVDVSLAACAKKTLSELGFPKIAVYSGSLELGLADFAPYNVIIVEGAVRFVFSRWLDQLTIGGRLVAVVNNFNSLSSRAMMYTRLVGGVTEAFLFNCFVPMLPCEWTEGTFEL